MKKNNPLAAQQTPPAFANDPSGFFGAILARNSGEGIGSLLPSNTVSQSDVAVKGRLLTSQIAWTPAAARWKGCNLTVSLSDAQFALVLEEGGDTQPGRITILVTKLQFSGFAKGWPAYEDTFSIQVGSVWQEFVIVEMVGHHDENDPGLTLFLEKDTNELGN